MAGYIGDGGDTNGNIEGLGKDKVKVTDYQEVGDERNTTNVFCFSFSGIGARNSLSNAVSRASEVQGVGEEVPCVSSFNSHSFRIRNPLRLREDLKKNHVDAAVKAVEEEQRWKDKLKLQVEKLSETVETLKAENKKLNSTVSYLQCQLTGVVDTTMLLGKPVTDQSNSELDEHGAKGCGRRFPCTNCAATFTKKGNMKRHVRTMHDQNNKKVITCTVCDKTFPDKTDLKSHMAIHTGVKEYLCSVCGKGFLKKKTLDRHMQNHN